MFIGTLSPEDKAFVASVLKQARAAGYTKVVEPCAGQLAMSCIAADLGFEDIEASDITLFSGVLGRHVEGRGIEDMDVTRIEDGSKITDPVQVMLEIKRAQLAMGSGSVYGEAMLLDFDERRDEIYESVKKTMDELRERIPNLTYRDMDMFDQIRAVRDEKCVILCMCPTYGGGYERFYRAIDETVSWEEPPFSMFEPPEGYRKLLETVEGCPCLLIIYEEVASGQHVGTPVYGRQAGRPGMNMYLVASDPDEVERILGRECARKRPGKMAPSRWPLVPSDHEITRKSKIEVAKLDSVHVRYYRKLLTHNFTPSAAGSGYAMLIDGYLAGIFGYTRIATDLGGKGDEAFLGFGMCVKTGYRLNRLMYSLAMQRRTLAMEYDDIQMHTLSTVKTAMLTKHPESKEMRGLMKLVAKERDDRMGYKLTYAAPVQDKTCRQCLDEFLRKEEQWRKRRA